MNNLHTRLPPWRSMLFIPAIADRFIEKAPQTGADAIQLDLEDSIPAESKNIARKKLPEQVEKLKQSTDIIIRTNRDIDICIADINAAVIEGVKAITIPKVMGAEHLQLLDEYITQLEAKRQLPLGHIRLIAMIETVDALNKANDIAQSCQRIAGITLGSEDFSLDAGCEPSATYLFTPCQHIVYAAKSANIDAYGFPSSIADYKNHQTLDSALTLASNMGFSGSFCIHPSQVHSINQAFTIDEQVVKQAEKIIEAYQHAIENNLGAIALDGKMIDLPVVEKAKITIKKANYFRHR